MGSPEHSLNIAQLALYLILIIPTPYIIFRHGKTGLLGWTYLFVFCSLRIIGSALAISKGEDSRSAAVISSIGLSPLILVLAGVLHEARKYRNPSLSRKLEITLEVLLHLLVSTGLALVAAGSSAFTSEVNPADPSSQKDHDSEETNLKVGVVILLVSWVVVGAWSFFSLLPSQCVRTVVGYREGTKLLYTLLFALPFIGLRLFISVVSFLAPSKHLSPIHAAFGLRLGLSFIPELIAVVAFIGMGVVTRGVKGVVGEGGHGRVEGGGVEMGKRERVWAENGNGV